MNAVIRPMALRDLDRVMEIAASLRHAPQWSPAAYVAATQPGGVPRRASVVAEDAQTGAICGFAVARILDREAELETIAVASEAQRQGLARRLFGALLSNFSKAMVTEVILEVRPSNQPALALYRSLRFTISGRRPRYYIDPVEDAILMNLRLGR